MPPARSPAGFLNARGGPTSGRSSFAGLSTAPSGRFSPRATTSRRSSSPRCSPWTGSTTPMWWPSWVPRRPCRSPTSPSTGRLPECGSGASTASSSPTPPRCRTAIWTCSSWGARWSRGRAASPMTSTSSCSRAAQRNWARRRSSRGSILPWSPCGPSWSCRTRCRRPSGRPSGPSRRPSSTRRFIRRFPVW